MVVVAGDRVLGMGQVIEKCHFSRRKIYLMIAAGQFPQPVKFGKATRWRESVIDQWIAETMDKGSERYAAVIVASPNTGRKETICLDCQGPAELVEGRPPVTIAQPNRADYASELTYRRAVTARFRCARCKRPFENAS